MQSITLNKPVLKKLVCHTVRSVVLAPQCLTASKQQRLVHNQPGLGGTVQHLADMHPAPRDSWKGDDNPGRRNCSAGLRCMLSCVHAAVTAVRAVPVGNLPTQRQPV